MTPRGDRRSLRAACWRALGAAAFAHVRQGEARLSRPASLHPISGLDHVLAMVAVGLWGAQLGAPAIWVLPVAFPLVMAIGRHARPPRRAAARRRVRHRRVGHRARSCGAVRSCGPPLVVAALVVGCFAIFHGHAHGTELPPGQSALLYSMGFVIATGCLHAVGIGIGTVHRWPWGRQLLRVRWPVVAAGGAFFMWKAVA